MKDFKFISGHSNSFELHKGQFNMRLDVVNNILLCLSLTYIENGERFLNRTTFEMTHSFGEYVELCEHLLSRYENSSVPSLAVFNIITFMENFIFIE